MDAAQPVREALDLQVVQQALDGIGLTGAVEVQQFTQGFSNLTYLLRTGDREVVLRCPPVGSTVKGAHDMAREYRILQAVRLRFDRVPRPLAYVEALHGYFMERVPGVILRHRPPPDTPLDAPIMRDLSEACVDTLVQLHGVSCAGLEDLGRGDGYVARQVGGWTGRYAQARTDDVADVDRTAAWLAEHQPPSAPACLIHNDYKYDNLVLDPPMLSHIRCVLDWEMATVGDPWMDLGTSLGYWVEATDDPALQALPFGLTALPGNLTRAQVVERYSRQRGPSPGPEAFYYAFGLFKIAVVAQQIYARYQQGLTRDERFAHLLAAVRLLARQAWQVCQRGDVSGL